MHIFRSQHYETWNQLQDNTLKNTWRLKKYPTKNKLVNQEIKEKTKNTWKQMKIKIQSKPFEVQQRKF